jgi:ubiquinol-cytochrome c reductase cytochrome b subunit
MSMVEVWQEPSRFWRWRYLEPPSDGSDAVELVSNEVYDEREAAVEAAMTAYPGVTVRELEMPPGAAPPGRARRTGPRGRLLAVLGLAAVLLAWRGRRRRRPPQR